MCHTGYSSTPTVELTWALILAAARNLTVESDSMRSGGWQRSVGVGLAGKTLALLGLGRIGSLVARIGQSFGMDTVAWSPNLTEQRAAEHGVTAVSKQELFSDADILTIHLGLGDSTRGIVGTAELHAMKPSAMLVNTSRGPIVDEAALVAALRTETIGGAALDVFDIEPLPADHCCAHYRTSCSAPIWDSSPASSIGLSTATRSRTSWPSRRDDPSVSCVEVCLVHDYANQLVRQGIPLARHFLRVRCSSGI